MLSCGDCQRWVVDIQTAKFAERGGRRQPRKAGQPTPCKLCPKESPKLEHLTILSDRNKQAVALYRRAKVGGLTDAERSDPVVQETLSLCSQIDDEFARFSLDRSSDKMLSAILPKGTKNG